MYVLKIENVSKYINDEKILSNIIVLDRFFIKGLIDDNYNFKMHIDVDEQENILAVKYSLEGNINESDSRLYN